MQLLWVSDDCLAGWLAGEGGETVYDSLREWKQLATYENLLIWGPDCGQRHREGKERRGTRFEQGLKKLMLLLAHLDGMLIGSSSSGVFVSCVCQCHGPELLLISKCCF